MSKSKTKHISVPTSLKILFWRSWRDVDTFPNMVEEERCMCSFQYGNDQGKEKEWKGGQESMVSDVYCIFSVALHSAPPIHPHQCPYQHFHCVGLLFQLLKNTAWWWLLCWLWDWKHGLTKAWSSADGSDSIVGTISGQFISVSKNWSQTLDIFSEQLRIYSEVLKYIISKMIISSKIPEKNWMDLWAGWGIEGPSV